MCRVVNKKHEDFDVYIGRPTKWSNPYYIGTHGTRKQVIAKYKKHLKKMIREGDVTLEELASLYGKRLGCSCKPLPCPGDVLAKAVIWAYYKLNG